jgi:hypothetical protein
MNAKHSCVSHFETRKWRERFKVIRIVLVYSESEEFELESQGRIGSDSHLMSMDG